MFNDNDINLNSSVVEKKQCTKCDMDKDLSSFRNDKRLKSGVSNHCKECEGKYFREYRANNKDKRKETNEKWKKKNPNYSKEFREKYPEKVKERNKKSQKKRNENGYFKEYAKKNKDSMLEYAREYEKKNAEKRKKQRAENRKTKMPSIRATINKWNKKKRETDNLFKLKDNLRARTGAAFRQKNWRKNGKTQMLLGAPFEIVMAHIERQFTEGMSWKNKGKGIGKWEIDHVIPLSSAKTKEELILLCHYSNLRPLWSPENNFKRAKLPKNHQMKLTV